MSKPVSQKSNGYFASMRRNYTHSMAFQWLQRNKPKVADAIMQESYKRFPAKKPRRRLTLIPENIAKLK